MSFRIMYIVHKYLRYLSLTGMLLSSALMALGQISPGKLTEVHKHLEGITNCTKCHSLGNKVTNEKCLSCHTEVKARLTMQTGYHASKAIRGKNCTQCHSDHHGTTFQIIRFDKNTFNHELTGYKLSGAHAKKQCQDCHRKENIKDVKSSGKKFTYMGLSQDCASCHKDYHQENLPDRCGDCHGFDAFKPAVKFSHDKAKFRLLGQHQTVPCLKCHPVTIRKDVKYQEFRGIRFSGCGNCHTDVHLGKLGQECARCHSEVSFHTVGGMNDFDHSKTQFALAGKHQSVSCSSCHKNSLRGPIPHARCTDCHKDFHNGQFIAPGQTGECSECHTTRGFSEILYPVDKHNSGPFKLTGAHLTTPCMACHKKQEKWSFRQIGTRCTDCHSDPHSGLLNQKYYPGRTCEQCHQTSAWARVSFNHDSTAFRLSAPHSKQACRLCHYRKDEGGKARQQFTGLSLSCAGCHSDVHQNQFAIAGVTDCKRCHEAEQWKIKTFDHNKTSFRLDSKHQNVACDKCHKKVTGAKTSYVLYKIPKWECRDCHTFQQWGEQPR